MRSKLLLLLALLSLPVFAQGNPAEAQGEPAASGLFVKVQLSRSLKVSKLRAGEVIEGRLAQTVYSGHSQIFPAGSVARLTVDHLEKRARPRNDHWPWMVKVFTPRRENYPVVRSASIVGEGGVETPLQISLVSVAPEIEIHSKAKGATPGLASPPAAGESENKSNSKRDAHTVFTLLTKGTIPSPGSRPAESSSAVASVLPGAEARVILLGDISASRSRAGDTFQARLVAPVTVNSRIVLPEGSILHGRVLKSTPPRTLSRAGSLSLGFTDLTLPGESTSSPIAASLSGVQLHSRSRTNIDAEGRLRGDRPGKAWMLINLGASAGVAKLVDDSAQLVVEAIVAGATDASTAGASRLAAMTASGIFLLTRHGRDVVLPKFTQMNIVFDRPSTSSAEPAQPGE